MTEVKPTEDRTAGPAPIDNDVLDAMAHVAWEKLGMVGMEDVRKAIELMLNAAWFEGYQLHSDAAIQNIARKRDEVINAYEPMRKALQKVMVGGNHLGLIIGADHPPHTANHEEARAHYGDAIWTYEAWCCWKTIMEARPALSTLPVIDRQTSDDVGRLREALEATTAEIERDLNDYLSSVCVVRDDVPDRSTMEPEDAEEVARLECIIWRARAALKGVPQPASEAGKA